MTRFPIFLSRTNAPVFHNEHPTADPWSSLPTVWQSALRARLRPGEELQAWLVTDLNPDLRYAEELVVLTNQRVLWEPDRTSANPTSADRAEAWELASGMVWTHREFAGLGSVELVGGQGRLAEWRYTAARAGAAAAFVQRCQQILRGAGVTGESETARGGGVCPSCGVALPDGESECPTCTPSAAPPPARSLFRLARFGHAQRRQIAIGFVLTLGATATGLVPPYLTMPLLDRVLIPLQNGQREMFPQVFWYLSGLLLAALLTWVLTWSRTYVMSRVSESIAADLRNQTYDHLTRLSLEFFGGKRTGDLMARISSDTDRICSFLSINVLDFATDVLMILMTSAILLSIDVRLALATLLPFPAIAWLIQRVRIRLRHGFARAGHAWSEMVSVLADAIPGIRVVKAFAQERREVERFRRANDHVVDANNRINRLWALFDPTVTFLTEVGVLVIWAFGAWRVSEGSVTVGVLTAFLAYISRFYTRLDSMSQMLANTQRAAAATHRLFEILDRVPSVPEPVRPIKPGRLQGQIELRNVHFKYGSRTVIRGVNLAIEPGELVGVVGPSGAGKSTLVNLVCRFYDVADGAILVDGTDIRSFPIEDYRRNIGIVLQEPFLFYGTIAENIAYARPDAGRGEIVAAARAAHAHEFIMRLPDGYDSIVGERGQSLSGGERQRISIARALLTDPRILILDEATSSVDTETEREIQAALENLIRGRTTIAIAHRLSTLRRADRIVVVEDGRVVESGRHEELLERAGKYARLHHAQRELVDSVAVAN